MNQDVFMKNFKLAPENMPNMVDFNAYSETLKRNAEALSAANQRAAESLQSIMKRGADSVQKNTNEMFNSIKDAVSAGDIEQISQSSQKYMKASLESNINNAKEVLDVASKSSMEILDVVGKNMAENIGKAFKQPAAKKK